jgi:CHAD domain-containing protein
MSAEQAFKEILLLLLEVMQKNSAGTIKGRDTEYMHDYRVAIRKIRVALKQLNQLYPKTVSAEFKKLFSRLGELTTPVRDLDILLYQMPGYQQDFEAPEWQQLQPLREYLAQSRAEAQKKFVEELKSLQYRDKMKQFRDYLVKPEAENTEAASTGKAVFKLADEFLWDINKQTLQQGKAVAKSSDTEQLHDLRKTFKKLRYLTEFFRSLYPAVTLRSLLESLIDVQDSLGEFNDRYIQTGLLKAFIEQSTDEQAINASQHLIKILEQQQLEAGSRFKESYAAYASSEGQSRFKEMFVEYNGRKIKQ